MAKSKVFHKKVQNVSQTRNKTIKRSRKLLRILGHVHVYLYLFIYIDQMTYH